MTRRDLTRKTVTIASQIMVPTYPLFVLAIGLSLTLTPIDRLVETPAFDVANDLVPLRLWGLGFLLVAAGLASAMLTRSRLTYVKALAVMALWMAGWACVCIYAAITGTASWAAWTWPAFVALACFASMSSLLSGEV